MAIFRRDGDAYCVALITGPTHNFLGLEISSQGTDALVCMAQGESNPDHSIDEAQLESAVRTGVELASKHTDHPMVITKILYMKGDSPRYDIYQRCASLIVNRMLTHPTGYDGME